METLALVTMFTDAMSVANALMPLVAQQLNGGKPVTDDDVRAALGNKDAALARLDVVIAQRIAAERADAPAVKTPPTAGRLL